MTIHQQHWKLKQRFSTKCGLPLGAPSRVSWLFSLPVNFSQAWVVLHHYGSVALSLKFLQLPIRFARTFGINGKCSLTMSTPNFHFLCNEEAYKFHSKGRQKVSTLWGSTWINEQFHQCLDGTKWDCLHVHRIVLVRFFCVMSKHIRLSWHFLWKSLWAS